MLQFKSKKQIKDIFTSLLLHTPNHTQLKELRSQFLTYTEIENKVEEQILDELQETLAELEEKRDDLVYKLAFCRKDLTKQLRSDFEENDYNGKIEELKCVENICVICEKKKDGMEVKEIGRMGEENVLDELERLLVKKQCVKRKKEDAYLSSRKYFTGLY